MIVLRGRVKISSISLAGKEIVLNIINAGEIVGEIATLDGGERSGDAVAMSDCELLVLNRRDFMPFLENHADICLMLIKILCQRLRHTSEQVEDLQFPSSRRADRQGAAAAFANARGGRSVDGAAARTCTCSQSELAHIVGCSRESVNKQLQAWHKAGFIDLAKGSIVIRDPAAIEQLI